MDNLGILQSAAINMYYRQIILNKGIPFDIKITMQDKMTQEEFNGMLETSINQAKAGELLELEEAFKLLEKGLLWKNL